MDAVGAIAALAVIIITGFIGQWIFKKTSVPDVILLIALGMIIGPQVLGLIDNDMMTSLTGMQEFLMALALVFILFDGGLGLRFKSVMENIQIAVFQTVTSFLLSLVTVTLAGIFILGMSTIEALILGGIVGGTSGAVVLTIVPKMKMREKTRTMLSLESALTDVVVIVFVVVLVQMVLKENSSALDVTWIVSSKFALSALIGIVAGIIWLELLKMFEEMPFSYMLTLAVLFLIFAACESSPLQGSGAIAALFFGLVLGNKKHFEKVFKRIKLDFMLDEQIKYLNSEITFLLRSFFFVYLGLIFSMNIVTIWFILGCAIICAAIVLARYASAKLTTYVGDFDTFDEKGIFAMLPRGLAAAVLATYPAQQQLAFNAYTDNPFMENAGIFIQNSVLVVILTTTVLATIFTFMSEKHVNKNSCNRPLTGERKISYAEESYTEIIEFQRK